MKIEKTANNILRAVEESGKRHKLTYQEAVRAMTAALASLNAEQQRHNERKAAAHY